MPRGIASWRVSPRAPLDGCRRVGKYARLSLATSRIREWVRDHRTWAFALVLVVMLASIPGYKLIPGWGKPWGLDLDNVYLFHACSGRDDPYLVTGAQCHDPFGRAMPYPPLMYWALAWMRWVSFPAARWIWASFITAVLLWAAVVWSVPEPRAPRARAARLGAALVGVLLLTQFPAAFAIERGNNDTFVVLLWSAAVVLYLRDRRLLSGIAAGLATVAKLYPGGGCAVLLAGALGIAFSGRRSGENPGAWRASLRLVAGMAASSAAATVVFWSQTRHYLERVLPDFAAHLPRVSVHSHSVPSAFGAAAPAVSAALVLLWCAVAFFRMDRAPVEVFAGALAISTYVARVSFDYNLVTVHPLLIVLAARSLGGPRSASVLSFLVLALGLVAVTGHRGWFGDAGVLHTALQVVFLVLAGVLALLRPAQPALQPAPSAT